MKKYFVVTVILLAFAGSAWGAPAPKTIDAMSLFLSNFTELGFMNVSTEEMADPENYAEAVRFGVEHNFVNNFKSRVAANKKGYDSRYGAYRINGKYVAESVKKYLGLDVKMDRSAESEPPYFFDEENFHFNKPELGKIYYAKVTEVEGPVKGVYNASGVIYAVKNPKDVLCNFRATFKDHTWKGKKTYALISLESE